MGAAAFIGQTGYGADSPGEDLFDWVAQMSNIKTTLKVEGSGSELFTRLDDEPEAPVADDPDTVVYLAFTSGTTGRPKGVLHSDNTLLANARPMASDWSIDSNSVVYSFSPVSHNLGFGAMVMSLMAGSEFVMHDVGRGASVAKRLRSIGATFVVGVPTHAIDLLADLDSGAAPVASVKGFRLSGAAGSSDVAASLLEHGIPPQSGYGMTEAGSHHYTLPTDAIGKITETSGRACSGFEARIFDQEDPDRSLAAGEIGQIGVRGASLMLGYFDDQALTEQAFNAAGWFLTGDLGWLDNDAYLTVTGRIKDLIIRGGHNINPSRIEALAMSHPSVAVAAAIGVPDDRLGQRVCLVVAPTNGVGFDMQDILRHLADEGLSRFDMPEYVAQVSELPLTGSGKIRKHALTEMLANGALHPNPT